MKKSKLYVLLIIPLLSFSDLNIERVNGVLSSIKKIDNKPLTYYTENKTFLKKLKVTKAKSPKKADVILFPKTKKAKGIIIVDNYDDLKNNKNSIGAIYVKKGRTQIILVKERLKKRGLDLPNKYDRYLFKESFLCPLCLLK